MHHTTERRQTRRKAVRSCSNCQKSHKTCGNERPCEQCTKRGIPLRCIDGSRKRPKYLCDDLSSQRTEELDRAINFTGSIESRTWLDRDVGNQQFQSLIDATEPERNLYAHKKPSGALNLVEYVDPRVLHDSLFQPDGRTVGPPEIAHSPRDGNVYAISEMTDISRPNPQMGFYETTAINGDERGSTFGFAIKSGWSSTFFI